jgi:hypothetical protein
VKCVCNSLVLFWRPLIHHAGQVTLTCLISQHLSISYPRHHGVL